MRFINRPWETPCEILTVDCADLGRTGVAEVRMADSPLSVAVAIVLGAGGAASSECVRFLVDPVLDLTWTGAALLTFIVGSESGKSVAEELPSPVENFSGGSSADDLSAEAFPVELARVPVEDTDVAGTASRAGACWGVSWDAAI